ncbi:MAG: FmdB family zinc ribbon protein [Vicinamibacteria bacterium]
MPIYEYRCTKCGHRFEAIQKVDDAPLSKCEKCKGKTERLISSPAIQFKGSGWYITDYARKGETSSSSSSGSESSGKDSPAETAATEKPAAPKKSKEKAGSTPK